ncbi:MAG: cysteine synthase A [Firmicutes bacterium]|nr:cysteine synthase A [Bacillota bacterium]
MIYNSVLSLIGKTPIMRLNSIAAGYRVFAKIESFNPGGSIKDRIALNMIEDAEKKGYLQPGNTIVEPTSGNTGIGLSLVSAVKGYKIILIMPESMSEERKKLLKFYGAELILTPHEKGMTGAVEKARELVDNNPDYYMPSQFENPANPEAHIRNTSKEILAEFELIDAFIAAVGTGGTLTGTSQVLKEKMPDIKIYAVEPESSAVISGEEPGPHMIQGIGAGFIPDVLDKDIIDEIITIGNKEAYQMSLKLASQEGILAGISAGANVLAAVKVAKKTGKDKNILTIIPDTGERYLSLHTAFDII